MRTFNRVTLVGYVGRDFVINKTRKGVLVGGFTLMTSTYSKDGEHHAQWHNCVVFGDRANFLREQIKKGKKVFVDGELQYCDYTKDGVKFISSKIVVVTVSVFNEPINHEIGTVHIDENFIPY